MTIVYILLIILQAGVIVFILWWSKRKKKAQPVTNAYEEFREQALSITPTQLKIAIPNTEILVYGVVMDWDLGDSMITIAAYINGGASMYFSTGGGKTGGGKNPVVGEAAVELVTGAQEYLNHTVSVVKADPPVRGFITFYFLTNQRLYKAQQPLASFEKNDGPWYPLFQKANDVVNAMHANSNGTSH